MFVEAGVAKIPYFQVSCSEVWMIVTREEELFGLPSEYEYTHPDMYHFLMKSGTTKI